MSENVQTFSGKVNVADNLLVGTSHFFVDRQNNRVGIGTSTPDASSMLDVTGNIKSGGTITATGGFSGNGSGLTGVNSDSGSWVNGSSSNIHLAVSTDNVGIGVLDPSHKLDVNGDINIASGSSLKLGGTPAVFSNWSVDGSDIYRSSGNVGIGTTSPNNSLHIYKNANERTSGLFIEKAEGGTNAAALFFGVNNINENPGVAKAAIFYERNLVNGRGDLKFCNDASSDANNVSPETADTRMIIKNNGRIGIGDSDPESILHVQSDIAGSSSSIKKTAATASTSEYNYILNGPRAGTTSGGAVHFINGSGRSQDGGTSTYTMRNDSGNTRVGKVSTSTIIAGYPSYPDRPFAMVGKNNGRTYTGSYMIFNSQAYNDQGIYNSSNGRFTAPVAGYYMFTGSFLAGERESQTNTRWHFNGSEIAWGAAHYNFGSGINVNTTSCRPALSCHLIYYMNSGNYMNLKIVGGSMYGAYTGHSTVTCMYMGAK